jgi:phosphoglycerate dehydrogenase-like enzyme
MTRIAVLDDYQRVAASMADWGSLDAEVVFFDDHLADEAAIAERLAGFDIVCLMRERTPLTASLIAALPRLRFVVTTGMRNASVDLGALAERGIPISGTTGGSVATAELTWGLILALLRHIPTEAEAMRAGGWQTTIGRELRGRTLGLLGLGNLGSAVARVGLAFGCEVIAWSENLTDERAAEVGARRVERDELFRRSDILSIHLVLSERSRGLVGADELGLMRPGAVLVNTSRGPIVDEGALVAALRTGRIAGAGLDVYGTEPLPADHPLRSLDNVVLTPHLGYVTEESYRDFFPQTVEDIAAWLAGAPIRLLDPPR